MNEYNARLDEMHGRGFEIDLDTSGEECVITIWRPERPTIRWTGTGTTPLSALNRAAAKRAREILFEARSNA